MFTNIWLQRYEKLIEEEKEVSFVHCSNVDACLKIYRITCKMVPSSPSFSCPRGGKLNMQGVSSN